MTIERKMNYHRGQTLIRFKAGKIKIKKKGRTQYRHLRRAQLLPQTMAPYRDPETQDIALYGSEFESYSGERVRRLE